MIAVAETLKGRDFTKVSDWGHDELLAVLDLADRLKEAQQAGEEHRVLPGRTLAMIFQKPSLRTRVSFEVGMRHLGGSAMYLSQQEIGLGERESVGDAARVLSRMVDGIVARTFRHSDVVELARHASVPVVNGLSDDEHPCQVLADLLTMREHRGDLAGLRLAWVGDANNVLNSLLLAATRLGVHVRIGAPPGYEPDARLLETASDEAARSGVELEVMHDPRKAVQEAHFIYTDTWYSMGREAERETRLAVFRPYQVNADLLAAAAPGVKALHCLPAHRGEEITDEVLDGPASVVLDQAENRVHAQKAVLVRLMARGQVPGSKFQVPS